MSFEDAFSANVLALAPIVALFVLATVTFGAVIAKEALDRYTAPKGKKTTGKAGEIVDIKFLGDWVIKVFVEHRQYSVDVLYTGELQIHKGGFGTIEMARGWGVTYAKERGA